MAQQQLDTRSPIEKLQLDQATVQRFASVFCSAATCTSPGSDLNAFLLHPGIVSAWGLAETVGKSWDEFRDRLVQVLDGEVARILSDRTPKPVAQALKASPEQVTMWVVPDQFSLPDQSQPETPASEQQGSDQQGDDMSEDSSRKNSQEHLKDQINRQSAQGLAMQRHPKKPDLQVLALGRFCAEPAFGIHLRSEVVG